MKLPSAFALAVIALAVLAFASLFAVLLYVGSVEESTSANVVEHRTANQRDHNTLIEQCGR